MKIKKITYYFGNLILIAPYLMREMAFMLASSYGTSLVILSTYISFIQLNDDVQDKNVA